MLRMGAVALVAAVPAAALWWVIDWPRPWLVTLLVLVLFGGAYLAGAAALRFPELKAWVGRFR
jgi:hypothetical protein